MDTAPTEIYPLSLHDALPILQESPSILDGSPAPPAVSPKHAYGLLARLKYSTELKTASCTSCRGMPVLSTFVKAVRDRKSTRLNSSHLVISYAVFCLKKTLVHYISSFQTGIALPFCRSYALKLVCDIVTINPHVAIGCAMTNFATKNAVTPAGVLTDP